MGKSYFRKAVDAMEGYVPGFQPKVADYVKLNTNENPYPPSPAVLDAIRAEAERLRLYPDPTADVVRAEVAKLFDVTIDNVIIGNGSDELLALAIRAFVDAGQAVTFPDPTYSLYEVLVRIEGAVNRPVPFPEDWSLPEALFGNDSPLTLVANPNAPTGTAVPPEEIHRLADSLDGVLLVDEAYVDFAGTDCMRLATACANVVVTRSLSKSYSLAGLRAGFAVSSEVIIAGLMKVRDSYNVDRLAAAGAAAALVDQRHLKTNVARIRRTRARLADAFEALGFETLPSEANFLLARPPAGLAAKDYYEKLWERLILVRWFGRDRVRDFVRISIGTDDEIDKLLDATREILGRTRT